MAWLVIGSALVMIAVTLGFGLLQSISTRAEIASDRSPSFVSPDGTSAPLARVRVLDTGLTEATIFELGPRTNGAKPPPGVPSWPAPGEVWLSRAAAAQRSDNPYLDALIVGEDAGRITRAGLRDPDDVVVVMGVPREALEGKPGTGGLVGFGQPGHTGSEVDVAREISPRGLKILWIIGLAAIAAAGFGLMVAVSRVADTARKQRLAVLQLLGAPLRMVRAVAATNSVAWSSVGAGIGLVLAWPVANVLSDVGLFGITWWPSRAFNSRVIILSLVSVALIAAVGGARSVGTDAWNTRRRHADGPLSLLRLAPLVTGGLILASVVYSQAQHRHADVATPPRLAVFLLVAAGLCCLGVLLAAPLLTRLVARALGRRGRLSLRVAATRVDHHTRETARMGVALVMLVLICGVVLGASQSLAWEADARDTDARVIEIPAANDLGRPTPAAPIVAALSATAGNSALAQRQSGASAPLHSLADRRPTDLSYLFATSADDAPAVAGAIQAAWPDAPPLLNDRDVAGERGTALTSGTLLVCATLAALLVLVALGVNLLSLQYGRRGADLTLLAVGMSGRQVTAVRSWEVALAALPGPLLGALAAVPLGIAVMRLDHAGVPPSGVFGLIPAAVVGVVVMMSGCAALMGPRQGEVDRRSE